MKSRIAAILVSGALLMTALLAGPASSAQAAPQGVVGTVICLVRAIPILPPSPCPRNTDG